MSPMTGLLGVSAAVLVEEPGARASFLITPSLIPGNRLGNVDPQFIHSDRSSSSNRPTCNRSDRKSVVLDIGQHVSLASRPRDNGQPRSVTLAVPVRVSQ